MTVNQLIAELKIISDQGDGDASVIIEEQGLGYVGDLISVDTLMGGPNKSLTLLGSPSDD